MHIGCVLDDAARRLFAFVVSVVVTMLAALDLVSDGAREEHANRRALLDPHAGCGSPIINGLL